MAMEHVFGHGRLEALLERVVGKERFEQLAVESHQHAVLARAVERMGGNPAGPAVPAVVWQRSPERRGPGGEARTSRVSMRFTAREAARLKAMAAKNQVDAGTLTREMVLLAMEATEDQQRGVDGYMDKPADPPVVVAEAGGVRRDRVRVSRVA